MRLLPSLLCLLVVLHCSYAPPVTPEKKDSEIKDDLVRTYFIKTSELIFVTYVNAAVRILAFK